MIIAGYFCLIIFLLVLTAKGWTARSMSRYHILAATSLLLTWERMLRYFAWSFKSFYGETTVAYSLHHVSKWLSSTKLFEEAWTLVTSTPETWLISQRVCFLTIIWTLFLHRHQHRIPYTWAYMLLGQLVAISFAMNLYFVAVNCQHIAEESKRKGTRPSTSFALCISIALFSASIVTILPKHLFLTNLLFLHILLLLPLLAQSVTTSSTRSLYYLTSFVSAASTISCIVNVNSLGTVINSIRANPAMGSISNDMLMAMLSVIIWNWSTDNDGELPFWSIVTSPLIIPHITECP